MWSEADSVYGSDLVREVVVSVAPVSHIAEWVCHSLIDHWKDIWTVDFKHIYKLYFCYLKNCILGFYMLASMKADCYLWYTACISENG